MIIYFPQPENLNDFVDYETKLIKIRSWCRNNLLSEWKFVYSYDLSPNTAIGIDIPENEDAIAFKLKFNI